MNRTRLLVTGLVLSALLGLIDVISLPFGAVGTLRSRWPSWVPHSG
ncbi:hypothetical protein ACFYY3_19800 [Streptomyces sp. NPDC001812]